MKDFVRFSKTITRQFFAFSFIVFILFSSCACQTEGRGKQAESQELSHLFVWTGDPEYKSPKHSPVSLAYMSNQLEGIEEDWYKDSSFYHIWVKAFNDYDGDGIGDFRGITEKLDYIKNDLGCDAIWLSPIFDCSGKGSAVNYNMHGYDTVDYYEVNDYFGNEEHLMTLIEEAHKRDMKLIFDFVPNHTSNAHPWFILSGKREGGKDDWYLWSEERLSWSPMGSSSTWFSNIDRHQYYYGAFNAGMPDLNFRNYEVREEMKNVVRYWLNKGFDGVRIDAVRYLVEDSGTASGLIDTKATHEFFEELRREVIDPYAELGHPKFMVCEAWITGNRNWLNRYYGAEEAEFNMVFDFDFTGKLQTSIKFKNTAFFDYIAREFTSAKNPVHYGTFLSNHDNVANRPATSFKNESELRLATAVSLLLPSTPFIYYANEIGQEDQPNLQGEDIRLRYPLKWENVEAQIKDSKSLLALHRDLNLLRQNHSALTRGALEPCSVKGGDEVLAYTLGYEGEVILCVYNFSSTKVDECSIRLGNQGEKGQILYVSNDEVDFSFDYGEMQLSNFDARSFAVVLLK
ncbi:MAG TPA: alpha-amylase family glycosyl hydrolase [Treponemataceae bacterium]|nr:alpha-amylase family glycosyl hydrolase [Treponemataceae bacterium]HPM06189.1 alpha-amylase family glycosyl hydrolase [Treponemataceae bacterium]